MQGSPFLFEYVYKNRLAAIAAARLFYGFRVSLVPPLPPIGSGRNPLCGTEDPIEITGIVYAALLCNSVDLLICKSQFVFGIVHTALVDKLHDRYAVPPFESTQHIVFAHTETLSQILQCDFFLQSVLPDTDEFVPISGVFPRSMPAAFRFFGQQQRHQLSQALGSYSS